MPVSVRFGRHFDEEEIVQNYCVIHLSSVMRFTSCKSARKILLGAKLLPPRIPKVMFSL